MVRNVIGVGIIKKKLSAESKIQNYARDVLILLTLKLLKSSFFIKNDCYFSLINLSFVPI